MEWAQEHRHDELRKRLRETEDLNELMAVRIERTKRMVQRARLERALLLERLAQATRVAHADEVESPPASPLLPEAGAVEGERRDEPRRRSAPRDPRLPKRPQNAYIIFCEAERENVRQELAEKEGAEVPDMTRAMAEAWKALGVKGRKRYNELYREDRLRYIREMVAFPSAGLSATDQKEKQRAVKQLRDWENKSRTAGEDAEGEPDESDYSLAGDADDATEDEGKIKPEASAGVAGPHLLSEGPSEMEHEPPSEIDQEPPSEAYEEPASEAASEAPEGA